MVSIFPKTPKKRSYSDVAEISSSEDEQKCPIKEYLDSNPKQNKNNQNFPRFIVLESMEETTLSKLSPFIIQKVISANFQPKTVKKLQNGNLLIEVVQEKDANFLLKMKIFHDIKVKSFVHERLNTSRGVIRSRELSLCSIEEIKSELRDQGVIDARRITIKKEDRIIETNTFILNFNSPSIPKQLKIGYNIEKVEQYIPNPLRCLKCQRFGHHENQCRNQTVCGKCGERNPEHDSRNCVKNAQCANCGDNHPAYAKVCQKWKKEKEIMTVKHTRNIPYPDARKMVDGYIRDKTYSQVAKITANSKAEPNQEISKYDELVKELLKLEPEDLPNFIKKLKMSISKSHSNSNSQLITKPTAPTTQIPETSKKARKETVTNMKLPENQKDQPIITKNKFQILGNIENNETVEIKKKPNPQKAIKPDESETKDKPQSRSRSSSESKSRLKTKEKDPQQNSQTKTKTTNSLRMEIEEEGKQIKTQQKIKNKNQENKSSTSQEMEVESRKNKSKSLPQPTSKEKNKTKTLEEMEVEEQIPPNK